MDYWLNVDTPNRTQVLHVDQACGDVQRKGTFGVKKAGELTRVWGWLPFATVAAAHASAVSRLPIFQSLAFCSNCQKSRPSFGKEASREADPVDLKNDASVLSALRPEKPGLVYELVRDAGVDVSGWSVDQDGNPINPNTNTYRTSQWSLGGEDQPIVLCVWWSHLLERGAVIEHKDNSKDFQTRMANALAAPGRTRAEAQRLRGKINKSRDFDARVGEAFRKQKPVRFVLLDGDAAGWEVAATESSQTDHRALDPISWYVHDYDPFSGSYRFVRGVEPPAHVRVDPLDAVEDPGEDPVFRELLDALPLSETERDALVKLRVGQGYFRDQLLKRWGGCSVSGCRDEGVLIASHIVPWRHCQTGQSG